MDEEAEQYAASLDFAFFAVNYGYSKSDYWELTPKDKLFIAKAQEDKVVRETTLTRNAVLNAVNNALRQKGKPFVELWQEPAPMIDTERAQADMAALQAVEDRDGKDWVARIYGREEQHGTS